MNELRSLTFNDKTLQRVPGTTSRGDLKKNFYKIVISRKSLYIAKD